MRDLFVILAVVVFLVVLGGCAALSGGARAGVGAVATDAFPPLVPPGGPQEGWKWWDYLAFALASGGAYGVGSLVKGYVRERRAKDEKPPTG